MSHAQSVAIVGIGGIFPGSSDLEGFWSNILKGINTARDVPEGRWLLSPEEAYDPVGPLPDKVYSKRGCFIGDQALKQATEVIAEELGIGRGFLEKLDPMFHLGLYAGYRAFRDCRTKNLDLGRVGVIIGNIALPTEASSALAREILGRTFEEKVSGKNGQGSEGRTLPLNRYVAGLPGGLLAKALGLGGGSYTLDAACASSLYALKLAADELLAGRADAVITGGLSRPDCLYTQMGFSQLRALSPSGICAPFDARGDGLVVGEGAGMVVLKRTEDALRDEDHIYAVIRGMGLSNDVGGSLLAPVSEGQLRAMRPAYERAGWSPRDVDLIECHATGTPVGDAVEFGSLKALWGEEGWKPGECVIGGVKSNVGHLLTAAGGAALIKVLLSLKAETLPPTANFSVPHPQLSMHSSPFRVLTEPQPWIRRDHDTPRRAAISAFGFGGINAHVLIEEWREGRGRRAEVGSQRTEVGSQRTEVGSQRTEVGSQRAEVGGQKSEIGGQENGGASYCLHSEPPVAVVGMDAHFGPWKGWEAFGKRVLTGEDSIEPAPCRNWWGVKTSSAFRREGLHRFPFNGFTVEELFIPPDRFRIPPKELQEMLPQQLLMLQVAAGAMADAGLIDRESPRRKGLESREGNGPHDTTGVFIGIGLDLNTTNFQLRWWLPGKVGEWAERLGLKLSQEGLRTWTQSLRDAVGPPLTANRTMGALGGIVASRIAREFRIGGPGFTVSSEESSGIRALEVAVRSLQNGTIDQAVVGAVDLAGDVRSVLGTHADRPFSASGTIRPFHPQADGTLIGEGAAAVVLKRLEDALRDGDRIYAVVKGIGAATGGDVEACLPDVRAYRIALERACEDARIDPNTIGYIETYGSGHPDEDRREAQALSAFGVQPSRCALGSVKADIGHAGAASGLASLIKACLCLHREILPPLRNSSETQTALSSFLFPLFPQYWMRNRAEGPRRAAVSSFSVDGNCTHVILEAFESPAVESVTDGAGDSTTLRPHRSGGPSISRPEALFAVEADEVSGLLKGLKRLRTHVESFAEHDIEKAARVWWNENRLEPRKELGLVFIARSRRELLAQAAECESNIAPHSMIDAQPFTGDRIFFSPRPLGKSGKVAFVFPGSGNHYPGMGRDLSLYWPEIFRRQDARNGYLRSQFLPELFWNARSVEEINASPKAAIFGQVVLGTWVSDLIRSFGIRPEAAIGYSLGESAALFALGVWTDRDTMLRRMNESTLFTHDLAGPCRAVRKVWNLPEDEEVDWSLGVVDSPAETVREALKGREKVYLLIVNTPMECVVGGDRKAVGALVERLNCRFFPLYGVTTVHCEVVRPVEKAYRDLHLFETTPPPGVRFYSGARGRSYELSRESAADSILEQALHGLDFPRVIQASYEEGVRLFLEMGPGHSCTRMIGKILEGRPHVARSAAVAGRDAASSVLCLLGQLIAERVPVDLSPLYGGDELRAERCGLHLCDSASETRPPLRIALGGKPFRMALPEPIVNPTSADLRETDLKETGKSDHTPPALCTPHPSPPLPLASSWEPLLRRMEATEKAKAQAHEAYLRFSQNAAETLSQTLAFQMSLVEKMLYAEPDGIEDSSVSSPPPSPPSRYFDRAMCMEFAVGSIAAMLGPEFAVIDSYPTRVRLPDEPLMLVDRILSVEGEPRSLTSGRVITEHDIHPGAWYLDGGRIPTCIAVEAGQADLFLSGYLGIDFNTKGLAVYRLLDAVVTFHRELPGPGAVIRYDIRIDHFFRQGDTYLFKFNFEGTVNGEPLLTMKNGCAGFFTAEELAAGKGIVHTELDRRPMKGIRPEDWEPFVPMAVESYDEHRVDALRSGDLATCFGPLFDGLKLNNPLCIPGGRMSLVDRVVHLDPRGGRFGLGIIRAEADIRPDDWFLTCHFVDDRVMPGTLMYECCLHTLRIFLLRMGWVGEQDEVICGPVPGVPGQLKCRGQVIETTRKAAYEVSIKEIGYRPEPYAVVDALMYADGKPIVEITNMSCRFSGLTREKIRNRWNAKNDSGFRIPASASEEPETRSLKPLFDRDRILAFAVGKPSEAFGDRYRVFDSDRVIARLPGPPYQFLDRITQIDAEPWTMKAGGVIEAHYDVPPDEWYFKACGTPRSPEMPFSVLLEVALQPCGWLAAYMGSALTSEVDLSFRNLGGTAVQYEPVPPHAGTLTTTVKVTRVSSSGGMIIQNYDFEVRNKGRTLYKGDTYFGFFSKEALSNQVGIRDAGVYRPTPAEVERGRQFDYPTGFPFPDEPLRMVDHIDLFVPDGGPAGLGFIRGIKHVDPEEWFFKAHFHQDPVCPGSLGLESFLQVLKVVAVNRYGSRFGTRDSALTMAPGKLHSWLYRGQVIPSDGLVTVQACITSIDDGKRLIRADGFLSVDGRVIYRMNDFVLLIL